MALTLVESVKLMEIGPERTYAEVYAAAHPLGAVLPIENAPTGTWAYTLEQDLPTTGFRSLNEAFSESTGKVNPKVEKVAFAGGDLKVDNALIRMHGEGIVARQFAMKAKSLAHKIGDAFVNGNSISDPESFDGLATRLSSTTTAGQVLSEGSTSSGDPLQASSLDTLLSMVPGATHLLMSRAMQNIITAGGRSTSVLGYVGYSQDALGRKVTTYNDIPIVIMDPVDAVYTTLAFNETDAAGAGTACASIYACKFEPMYCFAFQTQPIIVTPSAFVEGPYRMGRIEWDVGLAIENPFSVARLRNISNAAMVA